MKSFYKLPQNLEKDIATYTDEVQRFVAGDMTHGFMKAKRVPFGVYEQRQNGTHMVRVRVAGGTVTAAQVRELAVLGREYGNGLLRITTRQDIQFHDVAIESTPPVMRRLMAVGLTSKGGGGNTVRNITACPYAGICPHEKFDVTPCAHAVTEYLIPLVGSYNLPRKYKIAFSGCAADCALAQASDLGFIAEVRNGQAGFRIVAGGGMGAHSRTADPLLDWVPTTEIIRIAEAVRRLFDKLGNRTNKHRARLRFVFEELGLEAVKQHYAAKYNETVVDGVPQWLEACPLTPSEETAAPTPPPLDKVNGISIMRQRQPGFVAVPLHAPLGFIPSDDLSRLGDLSERFSAETGLRTTRAQNLLLRFVREEGLPALVAELRLLDTDLITPGTLERFTVCAGASTCRLGICLARAAAQACADALDLSNLPREILEALPFHINGCSNACGQQPIAPIGFFGIAQRAHNKLVPSYAVTLGGYCDASGARLGKTAGKIPAAVMADFLRELVDDFVAGRHDTETFVSYYDRLGAHHFAAIVARHATIPSPEEHPEFYHDLGTDEPFSLAGRGAGECGAGVFDVINDDLETARKATKPLDIVAAATRALLITRGLDTREPNAGIRAFEQHFIDTGLISATHRAVLERARGFLQGWAGAFEGQEAAVSGLLQEVETLYKTLDANLEFHPGTASTQTSPPPPPAPGSGTAEIDLRGVGCPLNFVKVKMRLEDMASDETLTVVLDDGAPINNVPASLRQEGHTVEEIADLGDGHWRLVVRKGDVEETDGESCCATQCCGSKQHCSV